MKQYRHWQLGTLIPAILLLGLLADVTCRALPLRFLAFRGWEALRSNLNGIQGPFQISQRYRNSRTYGDLANMGNVRWFRDYRPEVFTTDTHGYRNGGCRTPPDAILIGTSFSAGVAVSDTETLSAQLAARTGHSIYNGSGAGFEPWRVHRLTRDLQMRGGVVIYEFLERTTIGPGPYTSEPPREHSLFTRLRIAALEAPYKVSPLKVLAERACKVVQDDRLLPNSYGSRVVRRTLRNGAPILFLPEDVARYRQVRDVRHVAEYFQWFAAELRKDNLSLIVLLVPDKYSVYQPLLWDAEPPPSEPYLDRVAECLRTAAIPFVSLATVFRSAAAERLERGEYIYWRDDTHWNAAGVAIAAEQLHWHLWPGD